MDTIFSFVKTDYTIIIVVLYFLDVVLHKLCRFPDCLIPLAVTLAGIGLAALSSASRAPDYLNLASIVFDSIAQGILCAGMSVYVHEFVSGLRKK